jgi:hypothetical protein
MTFEVGAGGSNSTLDKSSVRASTAPHMAPRIAPSVPTRLVTWKRLHQLGALAGPMGSRWGADLSKTAHRAPGDPMMRMRRETMYQVLQAQCAKSCAARWAVVCAAAGPDAVCGHGGSTGRLKGSVAAHARLHPQAGESERRTP